LQTYETSNPPDTDLCDLRAEDFTDDDLDLEIYGRSTQCQTNRYPVHGQMSASSLMLRQSERSTPVRPPRSDLKNASATSPFIRTRDSTKDEFRAHENESASGTDVTNGDTEKTISEITSQISDRVKAESEKIFNELRISVFRNLDVNLKSMRTKYEELGKKVARDCITAWVNKDQMSLQKDSSRYDYSLNNNRNL
jgi:hypothetical protein